jgi:uncharacterized protein (DUF433 family)
VAQGLTAYSYDPDVNPQRIPSEDLQLTELPADDLRFAVPLYTTAEAARLVGVPTSTFSSWARGYSRGNVTSNPIVTAFPAEAGQPTIPFVGLVEGMVAAAFRRAGVSMQHIRRSLEALASEMSLEHALASRRLYADGASILLDYAHEHDQERLLAVVVTGQRVFTPVVEQYLKRISYDGSGWAHLVVLPITPRELLVADPTRAFGRPIFAKGGAPMEEVLNRFRAGEPLRSVADDFDLAQEDVEDVIRAALPPAA